MEKDAGMKVLYLSEWYPNRYDISSGRCVQGHALCAVKQGVDVCVLFLYAIPANDKEALFEQQTKGIKEIYVYYHGSYIAALRRGWKYVQQHWGMPDLCQLNVLTKNVLLPLWLKITRSIPYIIVEHWTGYYPESGAYKKGIHSLIAQIAVRHAKMILPVSRELANQMQRHGLRNNDFRVICNVVYDCFFHAQTRKEDGIKRMLHASYFDDAHKNISDIVRAISLLAKQRQDFECVIVGDGRDREKVMNLATELNIPAHLIRWKGELEPMDVCNLFYQSDFFVFYSNYETAGIVLTESLACGKPVISSPVGIAPEIITPKTGLIIPKHQPDELATAMNWMLDHFGEYDAEQLRAVSAPYTEENVGRFLKRIYEEVIR